jgi:hypothetical protein
MGATDPSGWVICDGNLRSNATGIYNNLISMGLYSSNVSTSFTPLNIAVTTSTDGTTIKYIMKY